MLFYVDYDHGHAVSGWVVPENPLAISHLAVVMDGVRVAEIPARITDEKIRSYGWHSTGQCRFVIEEAEFPGLSAARRLEILDVESNILIYRRAPHPDVIQRKVILINTSIDPESVIQAAIFDHFQQSYFGIGRFSEEVCRLLFEAPWLTSSFQSGAIVVPRYEGYLQNEKTLTTLLVHDPFVEMATRLRWLQARSPVAVDQMQQWRLGPLTEAAELMADFDLEDTKSLKRLFRRLPESAYHFLYNPLTRQCGTRLPDDHVQPGNSIVAIEVLSRVGIVGHSDFFEAFVTTLFDQLGIEAAVPTPGPLPPEAIALADRLRGLKVAQEMLVFDVALADVVRAAVAKGWTNG